MSSPPLPKGNSDAAPFDCLLIGTSTLPIQCGELLLSRGQRVVGVFSSDAKVVAWARGRGISVGEPGEGLLDFLRRTPFDYLFSIDNEHVLTSEALALPRLGAINYHDAPLPRYAGTHATSWALLAGEKTHGVSWHLITELVDGGAILQQQVFPVSDADTAASLNAKCYEAAIASFGQLIDGLIDGAVVRKPQDLSKRTFFPRYRRPPAACLITWESAAVDIVRLVRALDLGAYPNPLGLPKVAIDDSYFAVRAAALGPELTNGQPGQIMGIRDHGLRIATGRGEVLIQEVSTLDGVPRSIAELAALYSLREGDFLRSPDTYTAERASACMDQSARHEARWVKLLAELDPAPLPFERRGAEGASAQCSGYEQVRIPIRDDTVATLSKVFNERALRDLLYGSFAVCLARLSGNCSFDLGYSDQDTEALVKGVEMLFSSVLPVRVTVDLDRGLGDLLESLTAARDRVKSYGSFASDIWPRYPALRGRVRYCRAAVQVVRDLDRYSPAPHADVLLVTTESGTRYHLLCRQGLGDRIGRRIASYLASLVRGIATEPFAALGDLPLMPEDERHQVLVRWNDTVVEYPRDQCLPQMIEAQVVRYPSKVAAVAGERQATYAELNSRANRLAHCLRSLGAGPDVVVAVCLPRGIDMLVAFLAVLKAGSAYLPLDPGYPLERSHWMIRDSGAPIVVADQSFVESEAIADIRPLPRVVHLDSTAGEMLVWPDSNPPSVASPDHLAYVIYTSGSTGTPKGVMIEHRGLVNNIHWQIREFGFDHSDRFLQWTAAVFDASMWELWTPLSVGATLVFALDEEVQDPRETLSLMRRERITFAQTVPSFFSTIVTEIERDGPLEELRLFVVGGEALPKVDAERWLASAGCALINMYGPSECTVDATGFRCRGGLESDIVPIGRPIANTRVHILDSRRQPVPPGVSGEIYVGGEGIARGYLNRPGLTAERFVPDPFRPGDRLYRTGDLGRYLLDGNIEFLGRIDHQVKVRGYRIELEEVESAIRSLPGVAQSVVTVSREEDEPGRLVAYVAPSSLDIGRLRETLKRRLPDYMIPSVIVPMPEIPTLVSGKVDRAALPKPGQNRPELAVAYAPAVTPRQASLVSIWETVLGVRPVGLDDNFFDLGGNSLLVVRMLARVEQELGRRVGIGQAFSKPTVRGLDLALQNEKTEVPVVSTPRSPAVDEIAIVGMAARFPGCRDVREYWQAISEGRELITFFEPEEIHPSIDRAKVELPNYVRARGVVVDADCFDAGFFGINQREADVIDPQQRMLLECSWHALEDAGIHGEALTEQRVGVFAGVGDTDYFHRNLAGNPQVKGYGEFRLRLANEKDFAASRIAYTLGLTGPAINVQTACSTSLVAVCQGMTSLRSGESDVALCGAAHLPVPQNSGHEYNEGSAHSRDGHCRPYDADASGTVFSSGVGMVVLMRADQARAEKRRIYAILKGCGVNNDGGGKMSFMAPSAEGQARVLALALGNARMEAGTVTYIEGHGTATPLGDPIEAEALASVYGDPKRPPYLGSVKGNIGHTDAAAGIAGLIKTALALYHRQLPPSINFEKPNVRIPLSEYGLQVNTRLRPWPPDRPLCAAVSSLGVGGTNAHVVLAADETGPMPEGEDGPQLLLMSAKRRQGVETYESILLEQLGTSAASPAIAATLARHRAHFVHRRFRVFDTRLPLDAQPHGQGEAAGDPPPVAFLFPGQGAQYRRMGVSLYHAYPAFRQTFDRCAEVLLDETQTDIRRLLHQGQQFGAPELGDLIDQTQFTQPLLFSIGMALSSLWQSMGIRPAALIGHSIGEYAAACVAGVFGLEDGLRLVAKRGRLMGALPAGAMLSVPLREDEVSLMIDAESSIAAINGPRSCVVSGPAESIAALRRTLSERGVVGTILRTSHAFHSPMMDPILKPFEAEVAKIRLAPPLVPIMSTVTATWLSEDEAMNPGYWARQLRLPVNFAGALQSLWSGRDYVGVELGPGTTGSILTRRVVGRNVAVPTLGADPEMERSTLLAAVGQLWIRGVKLDLSSIFPELPPVSLPGYPFSRERHWIEPAGPVVAGDTDVRALMRAQLKLLRCQIEYLDRSLSDAEGRGLESTTVTSAVRGG